MAIVLTDREEGQRAPARALVTVLVLVVSAHVEARRQPERSGVVRQREGDLDRAADVEGRRPLQRDAILAQVLGEAKNPASGCADLDGDRNRGAQAHVKTGIITPRWRRAR